MFRPVRVYFEPDALEYPLGREIHERCQAQGIEVKMTTSHNRVMGIPGEEFKDRYFEAKRTMVVGIRRGGEFQTSKPSADYALPLATGCPGHCEYCYLNTNLGRRSYVRIYVNMDEILAKAKAYIEKGEEKPVTFDGSCTSDPLVLEPWTKALATTIQFFAGQKDGRFRFVTKFSNVDSLLSIEHNNRTRFRFSINANRVSKEHEKGVPGVHSRLEAAGKVARAGYPMGFLLGPVMHFEGWQKEYRATLEEAAKQLQPPPDDLTFEIVTHRFTPRAKKIIDEVYPENKLPMEEEARTFKWGQFGYGKYLYQKETMQDLRSFFQDTIKELFPYAHFDYFV